MGFIYVISAMETIGDISGTVEAVVGSGLITGGLSALLLNAVLPLGPGVRRDR